jgi:hypothetical protein
MKNEMNRPFPVHLPCLVFCTLVYSRLNTVQNNIQHLFNRPIMNDVPAAAKCFLSVGVISKRQKQIIAEGPISISQKNVHVTLVKLVYLRFIGPAQNS